MYLSLPFLLFSNATSPTFLHCKCIATRVNQKALSYKKGKEFDIARFKTECLSALSVGFKCYMGLPQNLRRGLATYCRSSPCPIVLDRCICLLALEPLSSKLSNKTSQRRHRLRTNMPCVHLLLRKVWIPHPPGEDHRSE